MTRPLIVITPDVEVRAGRRGPTPYHLITRDYAHAVLASGGLPLFVPYTDDAAVLDDIIELADGLLLSGGDFDVDPALFGEPPHPALGTLKPERTHFERALYERAMARTLPILGVCGGMQLMNVLRGGTLWQDLAAQHAQPLEHQQPGPKHLPGHPITVHVDTWMHRCLGTSRVGVNSTHHQAIRALAPGLLVSAEAGDGIVEAFEDPDRPFFVGVQWHPEAMEDAAQLKIYQAFVDAARARRSA